jgi:hypothetical protein
MKNIHIIPKNKPSRFWVTNLGNLARCQDVEPIKKALGNNININITSDEEIKEEFLTKKIYVIDIQNGNIGKLTCKNNFFKGSSKLIEIEWKNKQNIWNYCHIRQIILTTDQDLIKDGVQAIDDEFLEWFVKNPTCEYVEVQCSGRNCIEEYGCTKEVCNGVKPLKIIIPKEEPKQETLEDAAKIWVNNRFTKQICGNESYPDIHASKEGIVESHILFAKWQQERMYSEEEVLKLLKEFHFVDENYKTWFEQFKKK